MTTVPITYPHSTTKPAVCDGAGQCAAPHNNNADSQPTAPTESLPSPLHDRTHLAHLQHQTLNAILHNSPSPTHIPPNQLTQTATTLLNKRRREVSLSAPILARELADQFPLLFNDYAATHPYPPSGPAADAAHFATFLHKSRHLPTAATRECLFLRARTGPRLQLHRLSRTLFLTLRFRSLIHIFPLFRRNNPHQ